MRVQWSSARIAVIVAILMSLMVAATPAAAIPTGSVGDVASETVSNASEASRITYDGAARGLVSHSLQPASDSLSATSLGAKRQRTDPYPSSVIGADERYRLSPANPRVAYLEIDFGLGSCTGTFVGPNVLLTAAHCLWLPDMGGWMTTMRVVPGKDGALEPYGSEYALTALVPNDWINSNAEDMTWDWGLVIMETSTLGNAVGYYTLGVLQTPSLSSATFNPAIIGYPGDKDLATQWMGQKGAFLGVEPFLLYHDIDTFPGQSGSAVLRGSDSMIVGIHTNGSPNVNIAQRVDAEMLTVLNDGCQEVGCTISTYTEPTTPPPPPPPPPGQDDAFWRTWARTDKPVADGNVVRTWMWGPQPYTEVIEEPFGDAPGGKRKVQYFDKSRMEITDPNGDASSIWYVTNGRLAFEMVLGKQEIAFDTWDESPNPAQVGVAGDPNDTLGPTYATFGTLLKAGKLPNGSTVVQRINRAGQISVDESLARHGVNALDVAPEVGSWVEFSQHTVADVFWEFMNTQGTVYVDGQLTTDLYFPNPFYGTGLPITEPYWTTVQVGGTPTEVLVQCFERRCLTYTPGNDPTWQVEAGNVGQHYYKWRYEQQQPTDGVPADQQLLVGWNINNWGPYEDDDASIVPVGNAIHYTTYSSVAVYGWVEPGRGDYSVSVDVRLVNVGAANPETTVACVVARLHETFNGSYALCLYADGLLTADYEYFDDDGVYQFDELVEAQASDLLRPMADWNTLKIVVKGNQIWFLVNNVLFGSANHDGPLTGMAGMYAVSLDGAPVEWAFTNFNVYAIE